MSDDDGTLSPDEAFGVLGNETRLAILRTLGEADEPLPFSTLYDRVDVDDSGQFNYHLDKVVGHFVRKDDDGYALERAGRRVVEAVLAGAVTETPGTERTPVDRTCSLCGGPVEAAWTEGSVELYCTQCDGKWGRTRGGEPKGGAAEAGYLGRHLLPPAGLRGRDMDETVRAAWTWTILEVFAMASGICPRCSATVERSVGVCESHDASAGRCPTCDSHHAVTVGFECTNCIFVTGGAASLAVVNHPSVLRFLLDNGLDPLAPADTGVVEAVHEAYEEEILATDPLDARFTFDHDGATLTLRVDETLDVVEAHRGG
ncbi:winged helix-turn-helix domain-containing protein [Haloarcula litorea]|uniref:winged helix-turn-helix domain-containing protein n=1 Tax=Haloarcula litorea TaxID=3032579 RepID=UPI0023E78A14|nr:helix-turn-helix domain-containing protein [Halomicroarcula sp. GDY20]